MSLMHYDSDHRYTIWTVYAVSNGCQSAISVTLGLLTKYCRVYCFDGHYVIRS